jgi:hypothetical protein
MYKISDILLFGTELRLMTNLKYKSSVTALYIVKAQIRNFIPIYIKYLKY